MWLICPIAGVGKRLQPFTYSKPKAFLKIAGKRLIDHILIKLKNSFPKDTNICFIVGYKKRQITEYLKKNHSDYFNLQFIEQIPLGYEADTPFFSGIGDAILLAKDFAENDDCFVFFSDRLPMEDYSQILLDFHRDICDGIINVKQVENPEFYGVIELDENGIIRGIEEKPEKPKSNYAVSGAYLFGMSLAQRLFELLAKQNKITLENGQEHQLTPIIQQLIEEGFKLKTTEMKREILDFGRPDSLLAGNRLLLSELSTPDPTYEELFQSGNIIDSKIVPPVYIGKDSQISDSVIGPNVSIGDNVILKKCILSDSVVGDGANLKKIISSESIIGDYTVLEDLIKKSITIGDSSYITTSNAKSL
ncbi:MAG: sugar phosphate nucleotidyltransferase [Promethearchaeota archaeon]|jgi:glucose-1-phosphate thymidylyltransferase